jgi:hypothetical protein
LLHVAQALNADVTQWIGHGPWSQFAVSALCRHAAPPLVGSVTARVRLLLPAPHEALHAPYAVQPPYSQGTGQLCSLHVRPSLAWAHALPPNSGCDMLRVRVCDPVSQDLVQSVHEFHAWRSQSIAQKCWLQTVVSNLCRHSLPPVDDGVQERERLWLPAPVPVPCLTVWHDFVHVLQLDHWPITLSTGHSCVLHERVSEVCPHDEPPRLGGVFTRVRLWLPVPHDLVHVDHGVNVPSTHAIGHW